MAEGEEKKLGPNATYQPEDDKAPPTQTQGLDFSPGKSVNVVDLLGEEKGQTVLKKLAGNPSFKVDGGPDWKQQAEKKQQAQEEAAKDAEEARKKAEEAKSETPLPPEGWEGPEKAELESDSGARRPTMPKSGSQAGSSSRGGAKE